jgi:undecaprenyl-diphosphatase
MPVAVAISRMYRGEHHPTDILGSLLFSALWLTAATVLIRPNARWHTKRPASGGPPKLVPAPRAVS